MPTQPHDIVPAHLAVQAMRDNGYKNAAYALAELMDNAIQADATQVELLCGQRKQKATVRTRSRIEEIAVLDNGKGMDADTLRLALQFGNGTYLDEDNHTGIGRFGMGLPSSSVSQCQRVDVWSWQNGAENALYTYLDLNEIKQKHLTEVPEPQSRPIPNSWERVGQSWRESGTLVVWSQIDRCIWRTGSAIIDNSEFLIGRMYRKFLDQGEVSIRMLAFDLDDLSNKITEKYALPNDPLYLMKKTSCPEPFNDEPMFQPWAGEEQYEATFPINFREQQHKVKVRFSYAQESARIGQAPGSLPHGQHAKKNVGISIVRADRELELDTTLVNTYNPTERWWGIEVDFPPALDDLFGVTNNKQSARNFTELLQIEIESLLKDGKTIVQLKEELREDGDPRGPLLDIAKKIKSQLRIIRDLLDAQTKGSRSSSKRHQEHEAEKVATASTKKRQEEGIIGTSDKEEQSLTEEEQQTAIEQFWIEEGVTENIARELAASIVNDKLKYTCKGSPLSTAAFFEVKERGGAINVILNMKHPAYKNLVEIIEEDIDEADLETLRSRLGKARRGLELLLMAWARYEDEQPEGKLKQAAQDARYDWGRIARQFLEDKEEYT